MSKAARQQVIDATPRALENIVTTLRSGIGGITWKTNRSGIINQLMTEMMKVLNVSSISSDAWSENEKDLIKTRYLALKKDKNDTDFDPFPRIDPSPITRPSLEVTHVSSQPSTRDNIKVATGDVMRTLVHYPRLDKRQRVKTRKAILQRLDMAYRNKDDVLPRGYRLENFFTPSEIDALAAHYEELADDPQRQDFNPFFPGEHKSGPRLIHAEGREKNKRYREFLRDIPIIIQQEILHYRGKRPPMTSEISDVCNI